RRTSVEKEAHGRETSNRHAAVAIPIHAAESRCEPVVPPPAATRRNALSPGRRPAAFATRYGLNPRTLQDWEQGGAQTDGPARAYLLVILRGARAVERALAAEA